MASPYSRAEWNDIISRVNTLAVNPPAGCDAVAQLPLVPERHIWAKSDIRAVRNKLLDICSENSFEHELKYWSQGVLDEIEAAITSGWCDCPCELPDVTQTILQAWSIPVVRVDHVGTSANLCLFIPPAEPVFDWRSLANSLSMPPGVRAFASIRYHQLNPAGSVVSSRSLGTLQFNCDGSVRNPFAPAAPGFASDFLSTAYFVTRCTNLLESGVPECIGLPLCGGPTNAADKVQDDADAAAYVGSQQVWLANFTYSGCYECCPDGLGFKGIDCTTSGGGFG